ncbi:uncharacterized protein [Montipora foliosa]|uniref:uncharacterized protein n=1 Tax=Montipora foliosa TaxID=591990 RepID=UPI0035F1CF7D
MRDLLYFVIIGQLPASEATRQCFISASHMSISGWMLQRHIYKTMPADLGLRCLLECRTDNRCQSFNFVLSRRMCEFSNRTKKATPQDFVPDPDRYYFTRQNNRAPLGSIPELAAVSCKEIKASEGEAVSGRYWLSGVKPDMVVFAFCDMKTEDIDECSASPPICDVNAVCNNTLGSYNCCCKTGFTGDGKTCTNAGRSCKDIKKSHPSAEDGLYLLGPEEGNHSNAFQVYCDMTSYNGGWTMCYTTDEYAKPRTEVTYNAKTPYGSDGYSTDCNNILFTEIMFVDHQTGKKAYFKRKSNLSVKAAAQYGETGSALGLWDAVGASTAYSYQLLICDHSFYTGFFVSGLTRNCYKQCNSWCGDTSSPYFRTASTHSGYKGVAFNANGHQPVSPRLMNVGLR